MNRSPLYYPMSRGGDLEAGGAADLQTDVMRFMAILALCLVAIFALVQSLPLQPTIVETTPSLQLSPMETPAAAARESAVLPRVKAPQPLPMKKQGVAPATSSAARRFSSATPPAKSATPPSPPVASARQTVAIPTQPEPSPALPEPAAREPAYSAPLPSPTPVAADTPSSNDASDAPPDKGFSLKFESDAALTRLVARNEIGLYAISAKRALRMSVNRGSYSFWPASAPNQFHEMDPGTVPAEVVAALRRSGSLGLDPAVQWGVTLPTGMRRQLDGYLAEHSGGALVIEAAGNLRLEP